METGKVKLKLDWVTTEKCAYGILTQIAKINGGWLIKTYDYIMNGEIAISANSSQSFIPDPSHVLFADNGGED